MNDIRKGQIALTYLKNKIREEEKFITPNLRKEISNDVESMGFSEKEAVNFADIIVRELVQEMF